MKAMNKIFLVLTVVASTLFASAALAGYGRRDRGYDRHDNWDYGRRNSCGYYSSCSYRPYRQYYTPVYYTPRRVSYCPSHGYGGFNFSIGFSFSFNFSSYYNSYNCGCY